MVGNITQSFIESLQGGTTSETIEAEIIRPNGTGAFIEIKPVPFVEDGKVTGVRGVVRDITARKQAEEVLAQERNLLRSLIDHVPDLIYVKDAQSCFLIANPALARLTGVASPDELIGKTDFDFFPQELAAKYYADEQAIFQSGSTSARTRRTLGRRSRQQKMAFQHQNTSEECPRQNHWTRRPEPGHHRAQAGRGRFAGKRGTICGCSARRQ